MFQTWIITPIFFLFFVTSVMAQKKDQSVIYVYADAVESPGSSITLGPSLDFYSDLNVSANLLMTKTNPFGGVQGMLLRGANSDQVQVTLDGAVLNDPSHPSRGYNFSELNNLHFSSMDVYYGPHSSALGNYANSGAVNFKSLEITKPTLKIKAGSYDTQSLTVFMPVDILKQQWEFQSFKTRGMSSKKEGQEHDGIEENRLKIKGKYQKNNSFDLNYFLITQWKKEDLDFSAGNPDDNDYRTKSRLILPYVSLKTNPLDCVASEFSAQRTMRQRKDYNFPDNISSEEQFTKNDSSLDSLKLKNDLFCSNDYPSSMILQWDQEQMSIKQAGDIDSDLAKVDQTITSLSYLQDFKIAAAEKIDTNIKLDWWNNQFSLGSYRLGYSFMAGVVFISPSLSLAKKIPSLYQLYSEYGDANLEREKNWQLETIFKFVEKNNYTISITPFYSLYQQLIDYDQASNRYNNIGKTVIYGADLKTNLEIDPSLKTDLNINYLRSYNAKSGSELLLRPKWQASHSWTLIQEKMDYTLQAQYVHHRVASDAITFSQIDTGSYLVFNFLNRWRINSNFTLDNSIQNILNKDYVITPGYSTLGLSVFSELTYVF